MVSIDEIVRLGYSLELSESHNVLDLCCGYGQVLKTWHEAFGINGVGVDICKDFIETGRRRLEEAKINKINLVECDVLQYQDERKYDIVICSETFDSIENTLKLGEKYLKENGIIVYCKTYSKVDNPPQALEDFEGKLYTMNELNVHFNKLGYYITHLASDSTSDWERYITLEARRNLLNLKNKPNDPSKKEWADQWNEMYYKYRRKYEGQALFGLQK